MASERRLENRPDQTAKDGDGYDNAAPVEAAILFDIASRQQDREHDQDRDRADIDEHLHQADELRAEQKEKRGDADKRHHQRLSAA